MPVTTNPEAEFLLEGRPIPMQPGETWYVDFNLKHSVANRGAEPRVHLLVDCVVNDWIRELLESGEPL